jgi:hypothetical protein
MKNKNNDPLIIWFKDDEDKQQRKKPSLKTQIRNYLKTHYPDRIQDAPKK